MSVNGNRQSENRGEKRRYHKGGRIDGQDRKDVLRWKNYRNANELHGRKI